MYFDIHTHILPETDDGAKNLSESIKLLYLLKEQGVTSVLATPHFYPQQDSLENFQHTVNENFKRLTCASNRHSLPDIYLGCEMLYYNGISHSSSLSELCLNGSTFLLLELTDNYIKPETFKEIIQIREKFGITPIIAHVERYFKARQYKKFIKLLSEENIPVQINASSFEMPFYKKAAFNLLNTDLFCVIASDTHSIAHRAPKFTEAFALIEKVCGEEVKSKLIENSKQLYQKIILHGDNNAEIE